MQMATALTFQPVSVHWIMQSDPIEPSIPSITQKEGIGSASNFCYTPQALIDGAIERHLMRPVRSESGPERPVRSESGPKRPVRSESGPERPVRSESGPERTGRTRAMAGRAAVS